MLKKDEQLGETSFDSNILYEICLDLQNCALFNAIDARSKATK